MKNAIDGKPHYDDELGMVDLAAIFVRRLRVFYVVFGAVILLAILYAVFLVGEVKEYRTLVQLAEDNHEPLKSPSVVIASIDNRWYPEIEAVYAEAEGKRLPIKISASNPEDTNLIKLSTEASPELVDEIMNAHRQLIDQIVQHQSELLSRQKRALEQRMSSINETLEQLIRQEVAGEAMAVAIQERVDLEARLDSLRPAEILIVAREGLEAKGTSKKLIFALAIVLGLVLGIFSAFMAEFIEHVRRALREDVNGSV